MMAAADIGGGGNKKDPFRKWPKGLVGSLGIAYLLSGIFLMFAYFYCDNLGLKEPVYLFGLVVFCLILGFLGIKYDYKRLLKEIPLPDHLMGNVNEATKETDKTERMKPIAILKTLSLVVTTIIAFNCGKKSEPPKEEADQPYSHYMLTDYGSYVEIPHDPALNPTKGILPNAAYGM